MLAIYANMDYTSFTFTESRPLKKSKTPSPLARVASKSTSATTGVAYIDSLDLVELLARQDLGFDQRTRAPYEQRIKALAQEEATKRTQEIYERRRKHKEAKVRRRLEQRGAYNPSKMEEIMTESAEVGEMRVGSITKTEHHENVTDHVGDDTSTVSVGVPLHETPSGIQTQHDLNKFFERPFSIYDATWNSGTEYNIALKVWNLWSKNPAVRAKLSNYSSFRGTLHVKIATSGTPFHYGRIMASYQPYAKYNDTLNAYDDLLTKTVPTTAALLPPYKCYLSQARGVAYVDIKENAPLEMEIPFISYKQHFRLFNKSNLVITNATDLHDFEEAGELRLVTLNPILIANEDYDSSISVNVYAWCTDIQLGCISGTNIDVTAESNEVFTEARNRGRGAKPSAAIKQKAKKVEREAEDLEDAISDVDEEEEDQSWGGQFQKQQAERSKNWSKSMADKPLYSGHGNFGSRFMSSIEKGVSEDHDEYAEPGPVAKIASAVSGVGESLGDIPVIGGFAKATSTIAKGFGKVASWFGWSKPLVLEKPVFVKNNPFQNGAVLLGTDTAYKIACDPKQELTVDPTICGVPGEDEMAIQAIAARESWVTTFEWDSSDVAMSTVLWKTFVSPFFRTACTTMPGPDTTVLMQPTPLMYAAMPFRYWHGKIKIRFEFVCSKFHRGKVLFKYEPNTAMHALISSSDAQLNQQNTTILDLQDTQDITFEVDWAHARAWCNTSYDRTAFAFISDLPDIDISSTTAITQHYNNEVNGLIEVRPLNELVQPTDASKVYVNVYVSCDDLQVAVPYASDIPTTREYTFTESKVAESKVETINPTGSDIKGIHLDHFGEKVVSFRALMKRYVTMYVDDHTTAVTGPGWWEVFLPIVPRTTRRIGSSLINAPGWNPSTIWNHLKLAYLGHRGGHRYRFVLCKNGPGGNSHDYTRASLLGPSDYFSYDPLFQTQPGGTVSEVFGDAESNMLATLDGSITYHHHSNGGVEVAVPYYSDDLFSFACNNTDGYYVSSDDDMGWNPFKLNTFRVVFGATITSGEKGTVIIDHAIDEDFTFMHFLGAPFHCQQMGFALKFPKAVRMFCYCCVPKQVIEELRDVSPFEMKSDCGYGIYSLIVSLVVFVLTLIALYVYQDRGDGIIKMLGLPAPYHD